MIRKGEKGFTLIELLVVIGIISVLIVALILVVKPGEKLAQARDNRRLSDVETIYGVIEQYVFINSGELPGSDGNCFDNKSAGETFDAYECEIYLSDFLNELPRDPIYGTTEVTGYLVKKDVSGRVGVYAEYAEVDENITAGTW
jgi:prepilin-type N-terminal cleavage/methylation domain-containing protein